MKWSEDFFAESRELQSWNMALLMECNISIRVRSINMPLLSE